MQSKPFPKLHFTFFHINIIKKSRDVLLQKPAKKEEKQHRVGLFISV